MLSGGEHTRGIWSTEGKGEVAVGFSELSRIAIHRVSSLLSSAILTDMDKRTERSNHTGPKTHPQKTNERKTTNVDNPKPRPMKRGSIILLKMKFITK